MHTQTRVFAVQPLSTCPHLEEVQPLPPGGSLDAKQPCATCGDSSENWICLVCYQVRAVVILDLTYGGGRGVPGKTQHDYCCMAVI